MDTTQILQQHKSARSAHLTLTVRMIQQMCYLQSNHVIQTQLVALEAHNDCLIVTMVGY